MFPYLSERLHFTRADETQRHHYLKLVADPDIMRYITGNPLSEEEGIARYQRTLNYLTEHAILGGFIIRRLEDMEVVGSGKLSMEDDHTAELGYMLHKSFWGQGYASEITATFLDFARQIPELTRVIAIIDPANTASRKVLEKHGFQFDHHDTDAKIPTAYYSLRIR